MLKKWQRFFENQYGECRHLGFSHYIILDAKNGFYTDVLTLPPMFVKIFEMVEK